MICNGEIYNYEKLSKDLGITDLRSDVEIINHMLASSDDLELCFRKLDGDFVVFAILPDGSMVAARDPAGVRPLFFGTNESGKIIAFSSEVKGLINAPGVKRVSVFPPGQFWTPHNGFETYSDVLAG